MRRRVRGSFADEFGRSRKRHRMFRRFVITAIVVIGLLAVALLFRQMISGEDTCVEWQVAHQSTPTGELSGQRVCVCYLGEMCSFSNSGGQR